MKKSNRILAGIMALCIVGGVGVIPESIVPAVSMTASAEATVPAGLTLVGKGSEGEFSCSYYSDGTLSLDGYSGTSTVVNIPEYINGKKVRSLMADFFYYYGVNITDIYVPATVALVSSSGAGYTYAEAYSTMKSKYGLTLHMTGFDIPVEPEQPITLPYKYKILDDGTIEITDCDESATEVVIPSEIDGVTVTSIGKWAFLDCKSLVSVTIPDSITSIGDGAFGSCLKLTSVTIPNSVTSIGTSAFNGCSGLTSITIPDSVTSIGGNAFMGTPWLKAKKAENPLVVVNNILIDSTTCSGDVVIPDGVKSIEDCAFYFHSGLTSITIPESVINIGKSAFYHSGLKSITIPRSVTNIGKEAFGCSELTSVTILGDVTSIGDMAFSSCSELTSVTIPDGVTSIGGDAFSGTPWLKAKRAENPLVIVNNILIDGTTCSGDVVIPDSVTSISHAAFRSCSKLTSVTIPDSITNIPSGAFYNCNNLTEIIIPDSVTSIGDSAFSCSKNLKEITILNPECEIYDHSYTFTAYHSSVTATIKGYANSTAQAYAEKWGYNFESLGDAPEVSTTTTTQTTTKPTTTTTTTTTSKPTDVKYADSNGDGEISISDAVLIMQTLVNSDEYKLTEKNIQSADVVDGDGITGKDALAIQMVLANLITTDDLPTTSEKMDSPTK